MYYLNDFFIQLETFINDNNITEKIIDFYVSTKKILYDKNNSSYILNFNIEWICNVSR